MGGVIYNLSTTPVPSPITTAYTQICECCRPLSALLVSTGQGYETMILVSQ